jgi:hypothetical protein
MSRYQEEICEVVPETYHMLHSTILSEDIQIEPTSDNYSGDVSGDRRAH